MVESDTSPRGYRPAASGSGLFVPEAVSRTREVWTKADSKTLDRAIVLLQSRDLKMLLKCARLDCSSAQIERIKEPGTVFNLQCGCKNRHFTRAF